ncbi:MAG: membrane protein insertase YidC [Nitrospinae bacterium]|nr:membrane protein insertase YidC [Nitrospinota bacterium]
MMDRKFFLALFASMALLIGYNVYYEWRYGAYLQQQEQITAEKEEAKPGDKQEAKNLNKPAAGQPQAEAPSNVPGQVAPVAGSQVDEAAPGPMADSMFDKAVTAETAEKLIVIKTGVTEVTLTNRGAIPKNYLLEKYRDKTGNKMDLRFNFEQYQQKLSEQGKSLLNVKYIPPMGLKFPKDAFSDRVNGSLFTLGETRGEITLKEGDKPVTLVYLLEDPSGIKISKSYTFYPNSYSFDFSVQVISDPKWGVFDYSLVWFGLGDEDADLTGAVYSYHGPIILVGKERVAEAPDSDEPRKKYAGDVHWAALTNRYYAMVTTPVATATKTVTAQYVDDNNFALEWDFKSTLDKKAESFSVFVGPKEHEVLGKYTNGVYSVIDYGWFDIIAKPIYVVLSTFHGWTGNWGWSIIMLTVLAKVLFFPLSQKAFRSMQKLQKLQPQMKKLQEVYKDDRDTLNRELMALYKEQKVNPLGGCLPVIMQIPIFFALYKVLLESIELKGAGWALWIHDLAQQDPYYVTPVLMGITMLIQQMMTPKTGDPLQRKMMMALPVVFTFMFLSFPAGLVIYWLVNNILTIVQQWIIYREAK